MTHCDQIKHSEKQLEVQHQSDKTVRFQNKRSIWTELCEAMLKTYGQVAPESIDHPSFVAIQQSNGYSIKLKQFLRNITVLRCLRNGLLCGAVFWTFGGVNGEFLAEQQETGVTDEEVLLELTAGMSTRRLAAMDPVFAACITEKDNLMQKYRVVWAAYKAATGSDKETKKNECERLYALYQQKADECRNLE